MAAAQVTRSTAAAEMVLAAREKLALSGLRTSSPPSVRIEALPGGRERGSLQALNVSRSTSREPE